jgi:hypothetical protein
MSAVAALPVSYGGGWISTVLVTLSVSMATLVAFVILLISFLATSTVVGAGARLDNCHVKRIMVCQSTIAIRRGWCCTDRERLQEEY